MTLKIAFTLEQCWHEVPGGTAVAGIEMARAVQAIGEVQLIGVAAYHRSLPDPAFSPPIEVRHLKLPRIALYESWARMRVPRVESATGPVNVIHATTIAVPPKSRPIALSIYDLAFLRNPEHFTSHGLSFFKRNLEIALRDADLVLCCSEATRSDARDAGFSPNQLRLVPLGVSFALAGRDEVELVRSKYGLPAKYVLWTGTIEPRKNLKGLLKAFSQLDTDASLVLVGPKGWNEDIESLVAPLEDRVSVLGFVPRRHLEAIYAGATVFCFPSFTEGFGFPVLEAMAQGTPVVTSRGTSTEELGGDAVVLIDPYDPTSIAAGIAKVLGDGSFAGGLGTRGRERAALFSWDKTARLLGEIYTELAEKG